jgi:hypothetical protein
MAPYAALPGQLSSFIGRQQVMSTVSRRLGEDRPAPPTPLQGPLLKTKILIGRVETMGLEPTTPGCKARPGVRYTLVILRD